MYVTVFSYRGPVCFVNALSVTSTKIFIALSGELGINFLLYSSSWNFQISQVRCLCFPWLCYVSVYSFAVLLVLLPSAFSLDPDYHTQPRRRLYQLLTSCHQLLPHRSPYYFKNCYFRFCRVVSMCSFSILLIYSFYFCISFFIWIWMGNMMFVPRVAAKKYKWIHSQLTR
jgi:hypothetical protein